MGSALRELLGPPWAALPGPRVARTFHAWLALVSIAAWLSLGAQIHVLAGEHGLLPARDFIANAREAGASLREAPTLFWLAQDDGWLVAGVMAGLLLSLCALAGFGTRLALAANAVLYLSYTVVCDTFLSFQWDNMLVETCVLAACLSRERPAPYASLALRLLLFKLYFESGIAKWQSPIGDFQDGSAMSFYYETAPIPTWLAWHAHQLPAQLHRLESWAALFMELIVPFFVFGPRLLRLFACAYFTAFLIIDTATANYGFFTYLSLCLNLFLLDDADLERVSTWWSARFPRISRWFEDDSAGAAAAPDAQTTDSSMRAARTPQVVRLAHAGSASLLLAWSGASVVGALTHFADRAVTSSPLMAAHAQLRELRVANVYHLFGQITRERYEPEFQTLQGAQWVARAMRYKPGPVERPPPLVAPHQPRVDFRLWFYGLSFSRGTPRFVSVLLDRLCREPQHVQSLFVDALPRDTEAVRIVFHRYHFTTPAERATTSAYWRREEVSSTRALPCR